MRPLLPNVVPDGPADKEANKEESQESKAHLSPAMPPAFYEDDLARKTEKFKEAARRRNELKELLQKRGWQFKINDRNTNVKPDAKRNMQFKRTFSRMSSLATTTVDFNYVGNTNNLTNMLKSTNINVRNTQALNHVASLRHYEPRSTFKADEVFMYPVAREKFDAVGLDRPAFGEASATPSNLKLTDRKIEKVKYLR